MEDLTATRTVDGSLQKVTWPHEKLTNVDGRSQAARKVDRSSCTFSLYQVSGIRYQVFLFNLGSH